MEQTLSRISWIFSTAVLAAVVGVFATARVDDCRPHTASPQALRAAADSHAPQPTLAPRPELVVVHVEADKSDIQVSWADN